MTDWELVPASWAVVYREPDPPDKERPWVLHRPAAKWFRYLAILDDCIWEAFMEQVRLLLVINDEEWELLSAPLMAPFGWKRVACGRHPDREAMPAPQDGEE